MIILGLNAYHADSSAAIIVDGKLIAAAEEERFQRIKHWAGFPTHAVRFCLEQVGVSLSEVDYISLNRNPKSNLLPKSWFIINNLPSFSFILDRLNRFNKVTNIATVMGKEFEVDSDLILPKVRYIQHHHAHMASTFFVSHYDAAVVVSVDGIGDFTSTMWGMGEKNKLQTNDSIYFPHSLGLFYLAVTQLLGFNKYGDEYKVMALASFGEPTYLNKMKEIVILKKKGRYNLNLKYFRHHKFPTSMEWNGSEPKTEPLYSNLMEELLCPARKYLL